MAINLVRFELEDVEGIQDPVIPTLFVDEFGSATNAVETFGYWGKVRGELWPFRLVAGGDPNDALVDFGYSEGEDREIRYGTTNVRAISIREDSICHFSYAGDDWSVRLKRVVTAIDGLPFNPPSPTGPPATS